KQSPRNLHYEPHQRPESAPSGTALLPGRDEIRPHLPGKRFIRVSCSPFRPATCPGNGSPVINTGASAYIESYVVSRMLCEGPKVFCFDALTCEALENFDLNVSTGDYLQPFPRIVIELPKEYATKRHIDVS